VHKRPRSILLVVVLLLAVVSLVGCGVPQGQIDLSKPNGVWEIFVFALAQALRSLNHAIRGLGIPNSYGWAIIVFTIAIKLVTLPLTLKQLQSSRATQELQPKVAELQQKYVKDRQKLSEEQMKLYKEAGVNPLSGCLPMLIQMPILFALYQALYALANPSVGELQGQGFFWISDLSFPDLKTGMSWLSPAFGGQHFGMLAAYISLPVFMIVTQIILQKMSTPAPAPGQIKAGDQQRMMGQMMMFMPIMFGYITLGLPSGLTLYWSVSNILSIIQQYFITGWGSLATWLPALKRGRSVAAVETTDATPPTAPLTKPRRRRRHKQHAEDGSTS